MTPLYLECHITLEPLCEDRRAWAEDLIKPFGFKLAKLLMQKRNVDTPERSKYDTFCTGHAPPEQWDKLVMKMTCCIKSLQSAGFKVWRYKIESVMMDSRDEDIGGLLVY